MKRTPIWCYGNLAPMEASIEYLSALIILPMPSCGHELSSGTLPAAVGHDGCKVFYVKMKVSNFLLL